MKRVYIVFLLTAVLLLAGCQKESKERKQSKEWSYNSLYGVREYKDGFYYIKDHYWLRYYDTKSGKSVVLCEKNGCRHNSDKCFAYTEDGLPHIWGDKLCTVTSDGKIVVSDANNREKEELDTIGKARMKEEKCTLTVWDYIVSGDMLYVQTTITDYNSDVKYQEADTIFAYDMSTKEEKEITAIDETKQMLQMRMAKDGILYYTVQNKWDSEKDILSMTQEEQKEYWKEEEKKTHIEVYRADYFEGTVELVKEVDNGFVVAVNDDIGVYYYEFVGDGLANGIKLYHWNPEEEKEEVVLDREGKSPLQVTVPISSKHLIITLGEQSVIYNLDGFVQEEFVHPVLQEGLVFFVPGGYAFEKKTGEDENGGDLFKWYYLTEEEAQKPEGNAILVE